MGTEVQIREATHGDLDRVVELYDAICDYLELTGKIRPCPAGLECTVYEPREKKKGRAARRKTKRKGGKA